MSTPQEQIESQRHIYEETRNSPWHRHLMGPVEMEIMLKRAHGQECPKSSPGWSTARPRVAGWYLWREYEKSSPEVVYVTTLDYRSIERMRFRDGLPIGITKIYPEEGLTAQWKPIDLE